MSDELATKKDLQQSEGRLGMRIDETKSAVERVAAIVVRHDAELEEIKRTMATKTDMDRIMGGIMILTEKVDNYGRETITFPAILDEHGKRITNLEKRVSHLEGK